jgi:cytochrome P450
LATPRGASNFVARLTEQPSREPSHTQATTCGFSNPTVLLLPLDVLSDFEFGGRFLPAGTQVFLAIAAGHRLASVFDAPDRFDPDRFLPPRKGSTQAACAGNIRCSAARDVGYTRQWSSDERLLDVN